MKLNERTSSKCDCKARFTFCCLSGDIEIHADHVGGAKNEVNEGVSPQQSFKALVEILNTEDCPYSILIDEVLQCPSAISYHDPQLISVQPEECMVFTTDVTFGLSDVKSGFHKWSFFSQITEGT